MDKYIEVNGKRFDVELSGGSVCVIYDNGCYVDVALTTLLEKMGIEIKEEVELPTAENSVVTRRGDPEALVFVIYDEDWRDPYGRVYSTDLVQKMVSKRGYEVVYVGGQK